MAQTIVVVCDLCLDDGRPDVRGISVDLMIGDAVGTLDLCQDHRAQVEQLRQLVLRFARPINAGELVEPEGLAEKQEPQVRCGLCGRGIALKSRAAHARKVHDVKVGQIEWAGDLPYPCPAPECKYAAASPQGRAQHIRHEHPESDKASAA